MPNPSDMARGHGAEVETKDLAKLADAIRRPSWTGCARPCLRVKLPTTWSRFLYLRWSLYKWFFSPGTVRCSSRTVSCIPGRHLNRSGSGFVDPARDGYRSRLFGFHSLASRSCSVNLFNKWSSKNMTTYESHYRVRRYLPVEPIKKSLRKKKIAVA